jgi:hypothetical protein
MGQLGYRVNRVKLRLGKTLNPNQVEPYPLTQIGLSSLFWKYIQTILIQIQI